MSAAGWLVMCALLGFIASSSGGAKLKFERLGCYKDRGTRVFPNYYGDTSGTVVGCFNKALELGLDMFAVQNGGECWLNNKRGTDYSIYGESTECKDGLGGNWANDIYIIKSFCERSTSDGVCCEFPFVYKSKEYSSCITADNDGKEWCSTTPNYDEDEEWGECTDPCPKGWFYFQNSCYAFLYNRVYTWRTASSICSKLNARLVQINSAEENSYLAKNVADFVNTWIGLRRGKGNRFYWTDGSVPSYTHWSENEPNDAQGGEKCAEIRPGNGEWNDVKCTKSRGFICEKGY